MVQQRSCAEGEREVGLERDGGVRVGWEERPEMAWVWFAFLRASCISGAC